MTIQIGELTTEVRAEADPGTAGPAKEAPPPRAERARLVARLAQAPCDRLRTRAGGFDD